MFHVTQQESPAEYTLRAIATAAPDSEVSTTFREGLLDITMPWLELVEHRIPRTSGRHELVLPLNILASAARRQGLSVPLFLEQLRDYALGISREPEDSRCTLSMSMDHLTRLIRVDLNFVWDRGLVGTQVLTSKALPPAPRVTFCGTRFRRTAPKTE